MAFGIQNTTVPTLDNLTAITNVTDLPDLLININNDIYGGFFYFIMMWVLWVILYFAAQNFKDQPLINAMYGGAVVTLISFFLRVIVVTRDGVILGLLSDFQMWTFPLITMLLAALIWGLKR